MKNGAGRNCNLELIATLVDSRLLIYVWDTIHLVTGFLDQDSLIQAISRCLNSNQHFQQCPGLPDNSGMRNNLGHSIGSS